MDSSQKVPKGLSNEGLPWPASEIELAVEGVYRAAKPRYYGEGGPLIENGDVVMVASPLPDDPEWVGRIGAEGKPRGPGDSDMHAVLPREIKKEPIEMHDVSEANLTLVSKDGELHNGQH